MEFYFFKSLTDKGRSRLRCLPGQRLGGTPIDTSLNVSAEKGIRTTYPLGTVFVSDSLKLAASYYDAGDLFPIGIKDEDYVKNEHKPSKEMREAYNDFVGVVGSATSPLSDLPTADSTSKKSSFLSKMMASPKFKLPDINSDGFFVTPDNWYLLLRNIQNQVNTLMIGPTGSGKTELVILACKKLDIPCHVYDMGSMYDPVSGLLGVHRLQEGGVSTFDYAKFTEDISKPGVILLDELSRAPVTTNNILFPCLDSRRQLPVEIANSEGDRAIMVHEDCCFFATANVGSEYTGTMSLDRALVNRFFPLELDYLPKDKEEQLVIKRCGVSLSDARHIVGVASSVRNIYSRQEISCSLSTRETLMACELVADGWSVLSAMELVFLPLFEGTRSEGERSIVSKILMSK